MRRFFFTCLGCLFFLISFAQYTRWGIIAGVEIAKFSVNYIDYDAGWTDYHFKTGFKIAMEAEYPLGADFYLVPEFAFTQRGASQRNILSNEDCSYVINYFQIPVNVIYKYEIAPDVKIYGYAGPSVACAFSGSLKAKKNGIVTKNFKYIFGYDEYSEELKPIDIGLTMGVGVEYVDYFIRIQYAYGLSNLSNPPPHDTFYLKNRSIGIAVGYLF